MAAPRQRRERGTLRRAPAMELGGILVWILLPWPGALSGCAGSPSSSFELGADSGTNAPDDASEGDASRGVADGGAHGDAAYSPPGNNGPDAGSAPRRTNDAGAAQRDAAPASDGGCTPDLACTLAAPPTSGDIRQDCVDRVNQFRTQCACLKPLARWTAGEACADQMAQYDAMMNSGHAGARANGGQGICPWGEAQDECPGDYSESQVIGVCLQQMWSEGPPPNGVQACEADLTGCYEAHGHFINMSNPGVTKVACGFYTTSDGRVWSVQNLSP